MGTALTAITLLLVALLKNAELRAEAAVQSKLDALATGMLEAIRNEGQEADPMLERAIRIDEQL
jgi:low affinity Fe/Cu permease